VQTPASCAGHARRQPCERRGVAVGWLVPGLGVVVRWYTRIPILLY